MKRSSFNAALEATARIACFAALGPLLSCIEDPKEVEVDADGDGFFAEEDCDDNNADINPDAQEMCNSIDDNCDDVVDNDVTDGVSMYVDSDGDGYGDGDAVIVCEQQEGYSEVDGDCDDSDATLNLTDADEDGYSSCTGDCDDSDATLNLTDADEDGYSSCTGDCDDSVNWDMQDNDADGYTSCDGDCNDWNAAQTPVDADGDGYSTCDDDCDDSDALWNPEDNDGDGYSNCDGDCDDTIASNSENITEECFADCDEHITAVFSSENPQIETETLVCCSTVINNLGWENYGMHDHWGDCCDALTGGLFEAPACTPWGPPTPPKMHNTTKVLIA
jgi:hypothetical protein